MIVRNAVNCISGNRTIFSRRSVAGLCNASQLQIQPTIQSIPKNIPSYSNHSLARPFHPQFSRNYASSTLKFKQASITEDQYHEIADSCFDSLTESLEELVEGYDGPDADEYELEFASGVMTLRLGSHGTYVINKQPPNKQIWFSSPSSGPKRFDYDAMHKEWFMHKDGEEWNFRNLFNRELSEIFGKPIEVNLGE